MCKKLFLIIFSMLLAVIGFSQSHKILSEKKLKSDGPQGIETYELIKSVLGPDPIEAPDLYRVNHPNVKHIIEENDSILGNHFTFLIHRDTDKDRDTDNSDRQRNEIKAYADSDNELKAFYGESMRYHWYFKLDEGFSISKNFSHFFQLKAVGGSYSSQPIVTISGSINSNKPQFEIMHSSLTGNEDQQLNNTTWDKANNEKWMEMEVLVCYKDDGYLKVSVTNLDGDTILSTEQPHIDMWREGSDFVRPKWGIYRSLSTKQYLKEGEERAHFANFTIQKVILNYVPVPPNEATNGYPLNKGQCIDTAFTFSWIPGAYTGYSKFYLGTTSDLNQNNLLDSTNYSMHNIAALEANTTYFWRVDAVNDDGITKGEVWHFKTAPRASNCSTINILATKAINASVNLNGYENTNISDNHIETGWGFSGNSHWIELNLGIEANISHLMVAFYKGNEQYHNFEIQASTDQTNYFAVASYRSFGTTLNLQKVLLPETNAQFIRFLSTDTLSIEEPLIMEMYAFGCGGQISLPAKSELVYPENNAENLPTNLNVSWNSGIGATSHKLYLGTSETLNENNFVIETTNTFVNINNINHKQTYYWRVDEVNEAGIIIGEIWSFTTTYETIELIIQENAAGFMHLDGSIENTSEGFTGEGYANSKDEAGASITWKAIAKDNNYTLKWRYSNGTDNKSSAFVKINGIAIGIINFTSTENWNTWAMDSLNTALIEGENTIALSAIGATGLPNIDYLLIRGEHPLSIIPLRLETANNTLLNLYPNPCSNKLNITTDALKNHHIIIQLVDLSGKLVLDKMVLMDSLAKNAFTLNIEHIEKGFYVLNLKTTEYSVSRMIIKE